MIVRLAKTSFKIILDDIAADKSISHRCALFSLLAEGPSKIKNYLMTGDCLNSLEFIKTLGAKVEQKENGELLITPPQTIKSPSSILECGNAGTLMRLAIGLLAATEGSFVLSGDKYLNARPMLRVSDPLNAAGAKIYGRDGANLAPLYIEGSKLEYFELVNKKSSAQVKSAAILAGLLSNGCKIIEPLASRDHSEQLLNLMGANLKISDGIIEVSPINRKLKPLDVTVPNDPSSAFFFAVLCAIRPHSELVINNILLNKTRIEAYLVLERMGVEIEYIRDFGVADTGTMILRSPKILKAVEVSDNISWLIDELPALSIAMAHAQGKSKVINASELRVKESDRIKAIVNNLNACGVSCEELKDGFEINGCGEFNKTAKITSFADHRIAMAFSLMGVSCDVDIDNTECIKVSFARFFEILKEFGYAG